MRPVLEYVTEFAAGVAIWVHGPRDVVARSTLKKSSLKELSVQERSMRLEDTATALSTVGAAGIVARVVVPARLE